MNLKFSPSSGCLRAWRCKNSLLVICFLWFAVTAALGQIAGTATISAVPNGAKFDYTIILKNTGTSEIGTFWFAWTPPGQPIEYDFLPSAPSTLGQPAGWVGLASLGFPGYSIEYYNTNGSAIPAGQSATFRFTSSDAPATLQGSTFGFPNTTSFIYAGLPEVGATAQVNVVEVRDNTGSYDGLAVPSTGAVNPSQAVGLGRITITSSGAFSGKFTLGASATAVAFTGAFDSNGIARFSAARTPSLDLVRDGLPTLTLAMRLDSDFPQTQRIIGTLRRGTGLAANIVLNRRLYTSTVPAVAPLLNVPVRILDPATDQGNYTGIFQALSPSAQGRLASAYPQGDGWVLVSVRDTGLVTLRGELADGQPVSYSNYLSKDNVLPVYLPLYSGTGSLSGLIHFRNVAGQSDADGLGLRWFKPANPADTAYGNGWPLGIKVDFLGSKLVARAITGKTMLGNSPAVSPVVNALLNFRSGGLAGVLGNTLTLNAIGGVALHGPPPGGTAAQNLSAALAQSGTLQGTFGFPGTGAITSFRGVVLQKTQRASGYFLATPTGATKQQSGAVKITAQ